MCECVIKQTTCRSLMDINKVARDVMMSLPRRKMPAWVTVALLWCVAPLTMAAVAPLDIEVTIPPLLETQPSRSEVLFTVNHDPDQPPEPFTLPCRADALPAPSYSWLKNGENFDLDDDEEDKERVTMVEGEGSLVFHDPRPEDEGNYQCVAENSVGVAYSEVTPVRRAVMGNFPKAEPRVVTATLGQSLSLPCTPPEGYPEPSLHWVLQTSDGGLRSLNSPRLTVDEKGTLWFSYVVPEDASEDALYACAASSVTSSTQMYLVKDEEGRLEMVEEEPSEEVFTTINLQTEYRMGNWVYLNVSYPGDDKTTLPEDSQPPVQQYVSESQVTALEGDDIKLYCIYGGYPVPEVRWWRESRGDVESDKLDHYGKVLVLEDLEEVDMGSYYCQATNEAGESDTQHFTVYVEAAPEFVVEPGVINSPQGATAVFNCEASGDPKPTITWTKNGQLLDTHETTVVFDTLESSMKAAIACNASNEHGYVYKSVYLNVLSLPPEWLTEPADLAVLEGGAATLECEAYGSPDPNMTWAKMEGDEKVIIDDGDPRYDVEDNKLIIKSVDEDTEGQYICIATNKFASLNSVAEIVMREKTGAEASLSSDRVEANDHVSLNCLVKIDSHLKPEVTWFKDDVKINLKDDNYRLGRSEFPDNKIDDGDEDDDEDGREEETWVLEIMKVHGHDSGVYTCSVHTEVDDASDNVILTVEDVPNSPHLMTAHCEDREAFLEWSSTGDNNAPLQGFVIQYVTPFHPDDWKDAENKIPASSTSFSSRFQTIARVDMSPGLNYTFRVLAFNRVGMSDPSEDTAQCFPPGLPPDHHPYNVTVTGTSPGTLVISWQTMAPEEHNGPDFHYKVLWRTDDADDADDDEENVTTTDEVEGETKTEDEENDDDGWHTMIFDDWEKNQVEMTELPPYLEYEVEVEAHNAYGAAPPSLLTYTGHSGQDEPEDEPDDLKVLDADATDAVLTWTPVDQDSLNGLLLGYKIEYWEDHDGDDDDDELHEEVLATGSVGRAELKGLTPFMSYRARVSAVNSAFTGPASTIVAFKTAEGESGPVSNMESKQLGDDSLLLSWEAPEEPHGVVRGYKVHYCTINGDGEEGPVTNYSETLTPNLNIVKLTDLESGATYRVTVAAINGAGDGEGLSLDHDMEVLDPRVPAVPVFTWLVLEEEDEEQPGTDRDGDGDVDDNDVRNKNIIIGDTDGDGDVDEDDVLDTDNDGDIDEDDINVADINNDGTVDVEDVKAADRDNDGFVDIGDIGDEDGDGDFDGADVLAADEDGDGDIDSSDDDEEDVLLEDRDQDGDIDKDDVVDINHDGILDEKDFRAADVDNDGDVDEDDVKVADKDGDGDIDGADLTDLDKDGRVDGDDLEVVDIDGDGDVDSRDFSLKTVFLTDVDNDGDVDSDDVLDIDKDGDVDEDDHAIADIDNDGDVDADDVKAGDKDGDGDIDAVDIGDEDNDGDIDGLDVLKADKDGDGDIDASDDNEEGTLLEDRDGDGDFDREDVTDLDGDGDIDSEDIAAADVDDDGDVDMDDLNIADKDGDGDVDEADMADLDGDGKLDGDDLEINDRNADGVIDAKDFTFRNTLLADTDGDGDIDSDDVLDIDGDGDIDEEDIKAADIDDDGDIDGDDVKQGDKDGDNDVDSADVHDIDGDGFIDEDDLDVEDRDGDGDVDATDFALRKVFLGDTDGDGDVDREDVLDTDGDGDIDDKDFDVADINNDGNVDMKDVAAADRDHDGDVDEADIGDEDNDGDIDGNDVIAADEDGDGDIDAADDDGESILLSDTDGDGDVDLNDVIDLDGDGDIDEDDNKAADIDNDGDVDVDDVKAADRDKDGDVDAADIVDINDDGHIDGRDLVGLDRDNDGDIDSTDIENLDVFLKDTDGDGDVDEDDVLDVDHDGDIDEDDIAVADINNDGNIDSDDVVAGDRDGDNDVDFKDIGDEDGDGDIDGSDVVIADRDGDGDIDAADEGRGVEVRVNWTPDLEAHPGVDFYVQNRVKGTQHWKSSPVERQHLYQTISGLDPRRSYEVRIVAKDGPYETPSDIKYLAATEAMPTPGTVATPTSGVNNSPTSEELSHLEFVKPKVSESMDMEPNPILWTWFIIAVMVAVTMICIVFFSMWVYSQRIARVRELRAALYEGYEPSEPEPIKKEADVEAAKPAPEEAVEEEMTANYQRKENRKSWYHVQLAAMMKRQETVQSVDSFASHDDDFAEYGDESMAIDLLSSVSLVTNPRHQRPPPAPRT
ncbi:neuroglian-like isoform X6 [Homarus americanus]|uniref:neuroglian-like isoform X6 n=1 Tax=Homarus americanus TaxID=6706 RepID=UPI001C44F387|nr:neuroglian-like isoform X6 [Homarus americanus]